MRMRSVSTIGLIGGLIALSGCGAMQERRWSWCAVAGGVVGAGIGGGAAGGSVNAYEGGAGNDGSHEETAGAAAGGAVVGGIIGTVLGHLICDPVDEAPPPPPLAPPPPPPAPAPARKISLSADAYFDFNKATLKPGGEAEIDRVVSSMKENTRLHVLIEGHTDSIGSDAYNMRLSERRADAVRRYMVSEGIDDSRIETKGYGESQPVADNTSKEGRAKNRRVDLTIE